MTDRRIRPIVFGSLALLARFAALLCGLDRLPLVPSVNPEVIINDPALALSQGHGLVAFSFENSVNGLDHLYAHFPPVFVVLQSLVFRLFGFSALSLRALSVLFDLAACAVFLVIIQELESAKILDRAGSLLASLLVPLEASGLIHSREARMESLNTFLGAATLYFCLRACRGKGAPMTYWLAASCCVGIALAAHPAAALMWVVLFVWSLAEFRRLGMLRFLIVNAVPAVILLALSWTAYGSRLPEAVAQIRHLATFAGPPDLWISRLLSSIATKTPRDFQNSGGLGLIYTLAAIVLCLLRLLRPGGAPGAWSQTGWRILAIVAIQCAVVGFVIPTSGMNRAVMAFPFGMICAGIAVSHLPPARQRTLLAAGAVLVFLQIGMIALYLAELRKGWHEKASDRFNPIVMAIPPTARVAGPPELWFAFRSSGRQFAVIYRAMGEEAFWNGPSSFDSYDAIILDPNFPAYAEWKKKAEAGRPYERLVHTWSRDFLVVARTMDVSRIESR